ncbi:YkvA family protein [Pseudomonas sp. 5P_3.1_Bac2]|uniref:YkvA family protein n=1 Tax=Pseudomonas sp. 5P_3.1_Bac2 TaxID=2971617 RepID=UPI0021C58C79|nr:YkvA family protein [Pseudomonas sp. 5P_3.1_Bac2]MCU1716879.1 YkvA family protein [Pseudomonas sp. 5P_3.1_Bac2]
MTAPKNFHRYQLLAKRFLSAAKLPALLFSVARKRDKLGSGFSELSGQLKLLQALCLAWWRGEYRNVNKQALLSIVGALLYFVAPIDAIPDWLLGVGFVDDLAVLTWVLKTWSGELEAFERWRAGQSAQKLAEIERLPQLEGVEVVDRQTPGQP